MAFYLKEFSFLPKRKARGSDGIPAELLQSLGPEGIRNIIDVINKIYKSGKMPDAFLKSNSILLQKVNRRTQADKSWVKDTVAFNQKQNNQHH